MHPIWVVEVKVRNVHAPDLGGRVPPCGEQVSRWRAAGGW